MTSPKFSLRQEDKSDERVQEVLLRLLQGNRDAVKLVNDIAYIVHVWDDLVDGDQPVPAATVSRAFERAMVGLHFNPFFRENAALLLPVMLNGIVQWHGANALEADGGAHALQVAHVTRCSIGDVATMCMVAIGGSEYAAANAAEMRVLMQQDSLEDYLTDYQTALRKAP